MWLRRFAYVSLLRVRCVCYALGVFVSLVICCCLFNDFYDCGLCLFDCVCWCLLCLIVWLIVVYCNSVVCSLYFVIVGLLIVIFWFMVF